MYKDILFKYEQKIEHVIHIFIVKFIQENYHSVDDNFFRYLALGNKDMNKSV